MKVPPPYFYDLVCFGLLPDMMREYRRVDVVYKV